VSWTLTGSLASAVTVSSADGTLILDVAPGPGRAENYFALGQSFDATHIRGRTLRVAVDLRGTDLSGWAGAWARVDDVDDEASAFDNMHDRPLVGTASCHAVIQVPIGARARRVWVGTLQTGEGGLEASYFDVRVVDPEGAETVITLEDPDWQRFVRAHCEVDEPTREALAAASKPLATVLARGDRADLAAFIDGVRDAAVVGLGEATHGTREHFQLKHRLIEALVLDAGCRMVAFESNLVECLPVDDYIRGGTGRAEDVVAGMRFWTWATEEVVALIEWLRVFNASVPAHDHVRFVGVDAQFPVLPVRWLLRRLGKADPIGAADVAQHAIAVLSDTTASVAVGDPSERQRLTNWVETLAAHLRARDGDAATDLVAACATQSIANEADWRVRDRSMADNLCAYLTLFPQKGPIAFWAHNLHLGRHAMGPDASAGHELALRIGDRYQPVLLTQGGGAFRSNTGSWRGVTACSIAPPGEVSLEGGLLPSDHYIDLRAVDEPARSWLEAGPPAFMPGGGWGEGWERNEHLFGFDVAREADWLFHVHTTTPAVPTFGGHRPPPTTGPMLPTLPPLQDLDAWRSDHRATTTIDRRQVTDGVALTISDPALSILDAGMRCRINATAWRGRTVSVRALVDATTSDPFAPVVLSVTQVVGDDQHTAWGASLARQLVRLETSIDVGPLAEALDIRILLSGLGVLTVRDVQVL
jgi:erythromycin esterase